MSTRTTLVLLVVLSLAIVACLPAVGYGDEIVLARGAWSEYRIVLCRDASPSEHWAAMELATHLRQMTLAGVGEGYQKETANAPSRAIFIGFGPAVESLGVKADESLGQDGFIIKTVGKNLVVAGGRRAGTLYGVYALLERLGCRWWTLTESTIPKPWSIVIPNLDVREVPKFEYRDVMYGEIWPRQFLEWPLFLQRTWFPKDQ